MIKYLIAGIFGFGVAKLLSQKPTTKPTKKYDKGGEVKAEDMLKDPLTIKSLNDLDDGDGWWFEYFHAKTKNYLPNTYYHVNTGGLNAGVGKGLYLGRDKDALISFYDQEEENKKVDAYIGNPNWFDLMRYEDYSRFIEEAIRKYGKNYVEKNSLADIDIKGEMLKKLAIEKGFDGIRYYDPQATGEEFVLFNTNKVKKLSNSIFNKGGSTNKGGDCYYKAGQLILNNEFLENKIDYIGTPYLVHAEVQGQGAISNLRYGHAWIEDDVFVYDYSNNRKIVLPKDFYYRIGDIKTNNPKKYRKYNFEQAKRKMLETKNYGCWDLEVEYKKGGRTISQTPAPKKDQIKGSDKNKEGSAKDLTSAKKIKFADDVLEKIKNSVDKHNEKHPNKKITIDSAKAVVRRGMGAYSSTHRPTISGGNENSRVAWGLARLNAFTYKIINGKSKSGKYSQDDDLINELGYKVAKYEIGGELNNKIENIAKQVVLDLGETYSENEFVGKCKEISEEIAGRLNEMDIDAIPMRIVDGEDTKYNSPVFNHAYTFLPKTNQIIDTQIWQLEGQPDNLETRKVLFDWDDYNNLVELYEVEPISNWENRFSDGGDIQAYEEAMGISYAEGGEAKPKKVYVSIQLDNTYKEIPNTYNEYFTTYDEKTFEELKNGVLKGVVGVSSSPNNIAEWFIHRDCLIVMDYDEFMAINETEIINYYDPYQLMKNNLYLFKRLYANISRYGEQKDSYVFKQTLVKILEKIILEINLKMNLAEGQKLSELYRISRFLSPYETRAFPEWIEKNEIKIESPIDLTNAILDFNKLMDGASYLGYGFENPVLTFDELLPVVEKGITNASRVYDSEQEIVLNNRELNIPKNSQLFFIGKDEVGRERESNRDELIEKYNLKELYKLFFIDRQQIQKYRDFWLKKEEEKFNQKIETGKQDLEIKKSQVTDNLIDYFIQHSIDTVIDKVNKEILSYELGSLEFYDSTKDDYEEMNWVHIPLVNELFSKYTEIVEKSWEEIIENKSVNQVNLYSFNVFQDDAHRKLKTYFEQNRDKYEELDNYRNTKGRPSLNLSFFSYDLLKSLSDYQDLPEWIDYEELSKMYLNKMGVEIYRYYNKKDLPLISYYKQGGSVLLAPNGKPSNLTPEQYELVRTTEFISWFGDWENSPETASKVVDENGEPMVCRHYSQKPKRFNEFTKQKANDTRNFMSYAKEGFYFSTTDKKSIEKIYNRSKKGLLYEVFLNVKNILDLGNYNAYDFTTKKAVNWKEFTFEMLQKYVIKGRIGSFDDYTEYNANVDAFWIDEIDEKAKNKILKLGYNGVWGHKDKYADSFSNEFYGTDEIVIFNSNQIKLADGTNTTFDSNNADIRYKTGGEIKDLVVLHNINDYQIEEANKIGGLITPSIAILKAGQSFTDFGSITLIGTKKLIDPENRSVKVFAGDVYSPSVPKKLWYVDKRTLEKATTELIKKSLYYDENISKSNREIYHLVNQYIGNSSDFDRDIEKNSFNKLIEQYFEKLKLIYIVDKSIKIKVPFKDKRHFLWNNAEFTLTPEQKKRFAPILSEYTNESNETVSNGTSKKIRSKVYDLFLEVLNNIKLDIQEKYKNEKDGDKLYEIISKKILESFEKNVGTRYDWSGYTEYNLSKAVWSEKELDKEKLNQNIKKIFTKDVIENYKEWLSDFISQFQGSAYFLKGNEKMPYTLNYLVDATSNRVIGQEKNMTFGVNQAKSFGTKRLNSIAEIKKNSNNLISKEEMNLIDKKKSDNFFNLSESLKYSSSNDWGKLDSLSRAIADYYKGTSIVSALRKNDFSSPTSYQIDLFKYFADELKNSPVDYFEAKYQRAVSLSEFKYAVIPFNTDTKTIDILRSNKLIVKKYKTDEDRFQIVNNISEKDKSIKFDNGGNVNEFIIGKTFSGKQVRDIVSKYESQEGTDMQGFAISYIKLKDNYILDYVDIQKLIENDIDLKSFISDEYNPNENIEYDNIRQPILLGTNEYSKKQNTVLDGYHRVLQALYNKDKKIVAFVNLEFH